jgi:hypothetical protein
LNLLSNFRAWRKLKLSRSFTPTGRFKKHTTSNFLSASCQKL